MRIRRDKHPGVHRDSVRIWDVLEKNPLYQKAKNIFSYCSFGSEVETYFWLENVKRDGKRLCLPKVRADNQMDFMEVDVMQHMERNRYGIYEPSERAAVWVPDEHSLLLLPGLAFDYLGNRIGYGSGYYDRYLEKHPKPVTMGLCFDFQFCREVLPTGEQDQKVQYVATPQGIYCVGKGAWI